MTESAAEPTYPTTDLDLDLRWWAAANYLTIGQIYLRTTRSCATRWCSTTSSRGCSGTGAPAPGLSMIYALLNRVIRERERRLALRHRARARRPRARRGRLARGHVHRGLPARRPTTPTASARSSASSPRPAGCPATSACRRPGASTRAASSATPSSTRPARRSTTPTSSSPASSATARPRPVRWPRRGGCRPSSTPGGTARCCRSCTSTATRSPGPPCSAGPATRTSRPTCAARAGTRSPSAGDDPRQVFPALPPPCARAHDRDPGDPGRGARGDGPERAGAAPVAGHRPAHPEGLDRPRRGRRRPGRRAPTCAHQVPLSGLAENPEHLRMLEEWLRSYDPSEPLRRRRPPRPRAARRSPPTGDRRMSATPYANGGRLRDDAAAAGPRRLRGARSPRPASPWSRTP